VAHGADEGIEAARGTSGRCGASPSACGDTGAARDATTVSGVPAIEEE
jgi:hypothetical protein